MRKFDLAILVTVGGVVMWVKSFTRVFMILVLIFFVISVQAQQNPRAATAAEIAALPAYCQAKKKKGGREGPDKIWAERLGESWKNLHHYCNGLVFMNRGANPILDKEKRRYWLNMAATELSIIDRWPPNAPLLAEARMNQKQVELMQKMLKRY